MAKLFWLRIVNIVVVLLMSWTALASNQASNHYSPVNLENDHYQGITTIYYSDNQIGSANIQFKAQGDSIKLSKKAQSLILSHIKPSLTSYYKKKLRATLNKTLKAHSHLAKPDDAKSSTALSVYYAAPDRKLYVFIPPKFQKQSHNDHTQHEDFTTKRYKGAATIYHDSSQIGSANIQFKAQGDSIKLSKKAQSLILSHIKPSLTSYYTKKLRAALNKTLKAHSHLAKPDDAKSSTALSVYYAAPDRKLYVFIPPKFQKQSHNDHTQHEDFTTKRYKGAATIYHDSSQIGSANIQFKAQGDSIKLSKKAQSLILSHIKPSLTSDYTKKLRTALNRTLKAHSHLAKPEEAKSSTALSVYYTPSDRKLYVYIPPKFQKNQYDENIQPGPSAIQDYIGVASIYHNSSKIGSASITFKEKDDSITLSKKAQSLILSHIKPSLTSYYTKKLRAALNRTLKAHSHLAKPEEAKSPDAVSFYYAPSDMQLYVFIPPKFQKKYNQENNQYKTRVFKRYKGLVAMYHGSNQIGSADIEFKEQGDSISLSRKAQSLILSYMSASLQPDYKKKLHDALSKPVKAHSYLAHANEAKSSNAVSFYYAQSDRKLYIFIPQKFQKKPSNDKVQHPPTAAIVYKGAATIYHNSNQIGSADIEFKEQGDSVILSAKAQSLILSYMSASLQPDYKKKLHASLSKPLKAHSRLAKPDQAKSSSAVSFYYAQSDRKLYIFIPKKFQKEQNNENREDHITEPPPEPILSNETDVVSEINSANVTMTSGYVPPGFENITNNYQGVATIYHGKKEIGTADIDFDDTKDLVSLSEEAQSIIMMNITDRLIPDYITAIKDVLATPLEAHSRLANYYLARSPNKVTVHYSYSNMQLYVFIPNKFMKNKEKDYKFDPEYQHKIDYSPSLKSTLNFSYEHYNPQHLIWQSIGGINAGNTNLQYDVNGQIQGNFNDLYAQYLNYGYTIKLGYQESNHKNTIAPSGNIWGLSLTENPKMINKEFYQAYHAPLSINLTQPYDVTISYRGRTLFNGTLPQGDNIIDTTNFPKGSYSIDIQKRDLISGKTTTESQIFYGQSGKYNWLYSGFELHVGEESEYFNTIANERTPYIRISNGYKFYDGEVDLSYIHGEHLNFFGAEYDYIPSSSLDYNSSIYFSGLFDWYFSGNVSYMNGPASISSILQKWLPK